MQVKEVVKKMTKLYELAHIIRSKNSGPFEITLDILFKSEDEYMLVKKNGSITVDKIAKLYSVKPEFVNEPVYSDSACGIKITFARTVSSGSCFDRDVYGAQQHAPLMDIEINTYGG